MAKYAEEIIAESVKDLKWSNAKAREKEIEKLINYYTGTNTEHYISRYFDAEVFQEVPLYKINITKKFIDKKSRVYTLSPNRKLKNQRISKAYKNLTLYKDLRMKPKFENDIDYIMNWWKPKAIRRYVKLYDNDKLKPEVLFYGDIVGKTWEETKKQYIGEVGR